MTRREALTSTAFGVLLGVLLFAALLTAPWLAAGLVR